MNVLGWLCTRTRVVGVLVGVTGVVTDREYWIMDRDHGFGQIFVGGFEAFEQQFNDAVYSARCATAR